MREEIAQETLSQDVLDWEDLRLQVKAPQMPNRINERQSKPRHLIEKSSEHLRQKGKPLLTQKNENASGSAGWKETRRFRLPNSAGSNY